MAARYEIRKSDSQGFYYLLSIDAENNETVIKQSDDLKELQAMKGGKDARVVNEADTRGTVPPPKQPKRKK